MTNFVGWVVIELIKADSNRGIKPIFEAPPSKDYDLYLAITGATLLVILLSALFKKIQLGGKGRGIARYMGGTEAHLIKHKPHVKRALNVVEEMAIAAGMTPPPLYILTSEKSINAFAAGLTPQTSVIAVSQGCLENLTRDELQGVVAHEISHILNGDTRLNVQLLGYLAGLVTIGVMGRTVFRMVGRSRSRSSRDSGGALFLILFVGLSLWIVGSVGVFVGRMIRSAVSRQREFLADASAVQFTRYPAGIAGALAKIGQNSSVLNFAGAEEVSHMCFENPLKASAFSLNATHPPLKERIARIDKRFLEPGFLKTVLHKPEVSEIQKPTPKKNISAKDVINAIGEPTPENLASVSVMMNSLLPEISENRSETLQAQAIALALLNLSGDSSEGHAVVETYRSDELVAEFSQRRLELLRMERKNVLPALHHCIPILREMELPEKQIFLKTCEYMVKADSEVDLNEVSLYFLIEMHLIENSFRAERNNRSLVQSQQSVGYLISALCLHGNENTNKARWVFTETMKTLGLNVSFANEVHQMSLRSFRDLLQILAELKPQDKEKLFEAMLRTVEFDGEINANEMEFLKATCECMGIPIPYSI